MEIEQVFHQLVAPSKQLSVTVEKGMAGKYAHKISYGGPVRNRKQILKLIAEVDQALKDQYGSEKAA